MKLTQCYVRLLKREYSPKGYSIMQCSDEFSEPEYFELNVFPRKNKKSFSWKYSKDVETEAREFGKIKHLLKDEFKQLYK